MGAINRSDTPLRIAQIIGKWVGGGVETVVMNYYSNLNHDKIRFDFICDSDSVHIPYDEIEKMGGKVILVPPYQKVFQYYIELRNVLKEGNYTIVHSHINTLSVFALWIAWGVGVPVRIVHSHSTTNKKEKKKNFLKMVLRPFSKIFATDYMCCSKLAGCWQFGNRTYDKGKVYLLNNAIDVEKYQYDEMVRTEMRKELNIGDNTLVIGHIGRFVEQKNHRFLIDIFQELHKKEPDSILLLVGRGPLMEEMKEKVYSLSLTDSVQFLGQRNDADKLYQAFDIFLLPSLYEGLPVSGVEAQTSGLLCVLSDEITEEVKILDSTVFMSLSGSAMEWADQILSLYEQHQRKDTTKEVSDKGFDIKTESIRLENKYLSFYEEREERYAVSIRRVDCK